MSFEIGHDVIIVRNINDDFRKLKLKVISGSLKVYIKKVYFDNGGVQDVNLRYKKMNFSIKQGF